MMSREQYLLTCLAEECAEVAQLASKAIRFGLDARRPGAELNNKQRLTEELEDILGVMKMLKLEPHPYALAKKQEKVERYLEKSKGLGRVDDGQYAKLKEWYKEQQRLDDILNRPNKDRVIKTDRGNYYGP